MRDNRYENMWGETPEQQEQRRQHLYDVYDASAKKNERLADENNTFSAADMRRLSYKYAPYITPETWSYDKKAVTDDAENRRSVANYPLSHEVYQPQQQSEMQPSEPPYLEFNGEKLQLKDGNKTVRSFDAMSGQRGYQNPWDQEVTDYGPIPEGEWNVDYSTRKSYPRDKKDWGRRNFSSWGRDFVRLEPSKQTNTYGRTQFTIHGGKELGSAGCIDLAGQASDFMRYLDDYGNDMKLKVQYPNRPFARKK